MAAISRKTNVAPVAAPVAARNSAKAAPKVAAAPVVAPVAAAKAVKPARGKTAAAAAPVAAAEPARTYAPIPEDALIISTGEKTAFIATYTSFVDDKSVQHDSIVFTKGYRRADGALTMTGRSGTLPQAAFKGAKGKVLAKQIYDWLLTFSK